MKFCTTCLHYVFLSLALSKSLMAQPSIDLIEKAENNQVEAQLELAEVYQTEQKQKEAHYWLIKAASSGELKAMSKLGHFFQQQNANIDPLILAENWYFLAIGAGDINAESAYSNVLEAQFNQQRAKQVSSITLLDNQIDQDLSNDKPVIETIEPSSNNIFSTEVIFTFVIIIVTLTIVALRRKMKRNKQASLSYLEKTISTQDNKIRLLQQHINKAHQQLKRHQNVHQQNKVEQQLTIACAILGYKPEQIPNEKQIKNRYKLLSKIYHPDANGNNDEMKRLNNSVKLVISHIKANTKHNQS